MDAEEQKKAWQLVRTYGPANLWTGTTGPLAAALGRALKHIEYLEGTKPTRQHTPYNPMKIPMFGATPREEVRKRNV